ncbi:hrp65 protein-like isoform X2 [Onthophagus taurus]|uniref:hrp65 protein-like isoform X2 n=1 Tax=Onthophagus taurus TaxID=166361 RepID=UPI000C2052FC|nr:hrp65 protein-like isoform X2 [Onthophagus taurus]
MAEIDSVKVESSNDNHPEESSSHNTNGDNDGPQQQQQHFGERGPRRGGPGRFGKRRGGGNPDNRGRFQRKDQHQGDDFNSGPPGRQNERIFYDKLMEISGPSYDLPPIQNEEKKFSGRSRLYIGNISTDCEDNDILELFKPYGETSELFVNREKCFGFIRIDYHFNAERAKNELNGKVIKGRTLKIRFAPNSLTIKVKNLDEFVTNELLHVAFSIFGEIDRSVVIVDDHGKSIGEGIVEFTRKSSAQFALRKCQDECFFLTSSIRPVYVEPYLAQDEMDGYSEKFVPKRNPDFIQQRKIGPRFAETNSFEHEYGMRWKQLNELYKQKMEGLKKEQEIEQEKLLAQMEFARYEHDTAMLREQLRAREMDMGRQKREWEMKEQQVEEARRRSEEVMRRQQEEIESRMMHQEDEMRRRQQENSLFLQAQQLDNMLKDQGGFEEGGSAPPNKLRSPQAKTVTVIFNITVF